MNKTYLFAALFLAGCASAPVQSPAPAKAAQEADADQEAQCSVLGFSAALAIDAKNQGMTDAQLAGTIAKLKLEPALTPIERETIIDGALKGYSAPQGADPSIIGQKTFDDCMAGK